MAQTTVELDDDFIDTVIAQKMKELYNNTKYGNNMNMFHPDPVVNDEKVQRFLRSVRRVHNFFSLPADFIKKND